MSLLAGGGLNASAVLEQDEGKSPAPASVGVCLQVDVLNLSKLSKVFLDISILGFLANKDSKTEKFKLKYVHYLWKTSNKQLPVILMDRVGCFSCHFGKSFASICD